jgi:ubiquinone/menaquinone biosynthesis C-methylase UbiE
LKKLIQTSFAWGIHHVMKLYEPRIADRKRKLFSPVRGHVLEIGPGTGPNLQYFDKSVKWTGVESNPHMRAYLEREAARVGLEVDLIDGSAMNIPLPDASVDVVIGTLVLCSVPCQQTVLNEVHRVLKPGGQYLFVEHVAAPKGTWKAFVQRIIKPIWRCCADGCNIDRHTSATLKDSSFEQLEIERFDLKFPVVSPHIIGTATR